MVTRSVSRKASASDLLENSFRQSAGESGYTDSFVEHYLLPVIYPAGLTRGIQFWIAGCVVVVNIVIYAWLLYRWNWAQQRNSLIDTSSQE